MSTEIKSVASARTLTMRAFAGITYLSLRNPGDRTLDIDVSSTDLLAAIEAEGIGVMVEGTLPEVTVRGDRLVVGRMSWLVGSARRSRDGIAKDILDLLALLRWLDAHPPAPEVDEADVEALVDLIRTNPSWGVDGSKVLARDLLASGRVTVTR